MATTTLFKHPRHERHPLEPRDFSKDYIPRICDLCHWKVSADGYACLECKFYAHRACAKAPPRIDQHPFDTYHPLTLTHSLPPSINNVCDLCYIRHDSLFRCDECDFNMDIRCALSTLSHRAGSQENTPSQIKLPFHSHTLTSFSTRHNFIGDSNCVICKANIEGDGYACLTGLCEFMIHKICLQDLFGNETDFNLDIRSASSTLLDLEGSEGKTPKWIALPLHHHLLTLFSPRYDFVKTIACVICNASVKGDGYVCLHWQCEFIIHKACIQDLYYTDGTKAPQVYHRHPLETFLGENTVSSRCASCGSDESRECIGCPRCEVFIHRDCIKVPEIIQYPHHPDHNLVLLITCPDNDKLQCDSCLVSLEVQLCYGCPSCQFFMDVGCALRVLSYFEEGMSAKIELPWHEHPLLLCHRTKYESDSHSCCEDNSAGPMYTCKEKGCEILIHKQCTEIKRTIIHPHHPDHRLTFCEVTGSQICEACCCTLRFSGFSCKLCAFYLHIRCAACFPTRKHYLHEHELLQLDYSPCCECKRCGIRINLHFFRCVQCDLNLHKECLDLPLQVVNSKVHWHPLTLHETYIEDDSGEYYCDHCEKRRDERMGAYVCLQCPGRWAYHVECVFLELKKVFVKDNTISVERLNAEIARGEEEVREAETKLNEMKRELDEKRKKRAALIIIE